jgi:3-hydroxy acid dehydrogenase / malonic semialdehyde reductase
MTIVLYIYGMSKIILITGATSGIGKATAEIFAQNKWNIIITGRRQDRLTALQAFLEKEYEVQCLALCFDVQNKKQVKNAFENLPASWHTIDVLLNNAGLALGRDYFDEANMDDWETMIDTNVKGLLFVSKAIIPLMITNKTGHIINIGSTAGKEVYEKGNVYCATKHAVDAISKAQRIDLLQHQIKVTSIHPGAVDTEFSLVRFKGNYDNAKKVYEGYQPLSGADVAAVIYYAANTPKHLCINDLVLTCTAQANSFYLHK